MIKTSQLYSKRVLVVVAATAMAFGIALGLGAMLTGQGEAEQRLGAVDQSATASDGVITIEALRAEFGGTSVEVELRFSAPESERRPVGIAPNAAELNGVPGVSGRVRGNGTTTISFPSHAWPADATELTLTISSVQFIDERADIELVPGDWRLTIEVPESDEADQARTVDMLDPAVVQIAGEDVVITTTRSHDATVVRYELPPSAGSNSAPKLFVDGVAVEMQGSMQSGGPGAIEIRFAATEGGPMVLLLDDLYEVVSDPGEWEVTLGLDAFDPPDSASDGNSEPLVAEVEHRVLTSSRSPQILGVQWLRSGDHTWLSITLDGNWRAGPTRPVVLAHGEMMVVSSWGTVDSGVESNIVVELEPSDSIPRELTVRSNYEVQALPPVEVTLQP
ncbi:MAG: hypothetical protein KC482_15070 [Dehalococcoidia bacterium]|nr:hypothetical protein [Dehalococcoidia bacterium]MCA9843697.1 hypothetical protein [Dehalococcoidia bacterium]MCA9854882.1 hypothetical protein [Dehalococcoidia bacterium]